MAENKTQPTAQKVQDFLKEVEPEQKRKDSLEICKMMEEASGSKPTMWGDSIIGFGSYHYKYESGREGDFLRIGFSPRKQNISLYLMPSANSHQDLLQKLGKYKTGKSCLYINKLADVDLEILQKLIQLSVEKMAELYPQ